MQLNLQKAMNLNPHVHVHVCTCVSNLHCMYRYRYQLVGSFFQHFLHQHAIQLANIDEIPAVNRLHVQPFTLLLLCSVLFYVYTCVCAFVCALKSRIGNLKVCDMCMQGF